MHVELAAKLIGYGKYLTTAEEGDADADLMNAIVGKLPDTILRRYRNVKTSQALWTGLKKDYDTKNPLTEAHLERKLYNLSCYDIGKVNEHIDELLNIRNELTSRNITISDDQFKNALIASVPQSLNSTITAVMTVYSESNKDLTVDKLIAAIRAEANGQAMRRGKVKKEEANYSRDHSNNRGRGFNSRGRGWKFNDRQGGDRDRK